LIPYIFIIISFHIVFILSKLHLVEYNMYYILLEGLVLSFITLIFAIATLNEYS